MADARRITVAIDGPAGSGKSTVAKTVARELGYAYVDTGAMYRSVALLGMREGLSPDDAEGFIRQAATARMEFRVGESGQRLFVNDEDLTDEVRRPEVSALASPVSAIPDVRKHLTDTQRRMAAGGGVVMEGRDIGTVVCPDAEVKAFVTATPEERARRRFLELQEKGTDTTLEEVLTQMQARDERDSSRDIAPLVKAEDALGIITDRMSIDQVVGVVLDLVREAQAS